jgi:hypothetical protein
MPLGKFAQLVQLVLRVLAFVFRRHPRINRHLHPAKLRAARGTQQFFAQ